MARAVYALLVGIDAYEPPVPPLGGCVHDVAAAAASLRAHAAADGAALQLATLTDAAATRDAVVAAFRTHLGRAGPGDAAVFYFSGHGSQQPCAPELRHLEPDGLDETLVLHDSRRPGRYDLADKELGGLLAEVAARGPHVLVVLDCCHAGSGTRAGGARGGAVRRAPNDLRPRPADSYAAPPPARSALGTAPNGRAGQGDWVPAPSGDAVVLAACRADQRARELDLGGRRRGVFSYHLLDALERARGPLSYGTLYRRVKALVERQGGTRLTDGQTPEMEWGDAGLLRRPFLGGPGRAPPTDGAHFVLRHDPALGGWAVDGGAVHGVAPPADGETTTLAVHPFDADPRAPRAPKPLATARVTEVLPHASLVAVDDPAGALDAHETYAAAVVGVPLPRVAVRVDGDAEGVRRVLAALATAGPGGTPSPHVRAAEATADAELRVTARGGRYAVECLTLGGPADPRLTDGTAAAAPADVAGEGDEPARLVARQLEHAARWLTLARLANPGSGLAPDAVELAVYRVTGPSRVRNPADVPVERCAPAPVLRLAQDTRAAGPAVKLRLRNNDDEPLYCALAVLTDDYAVDVHTLLPGGKVRLAPGEEVWARQGRPVRVGVPEDAWDRGATEAAWRVKLLVSNRDFEATLLAQGPLEQPGTAARPAGRDTLARLAGGGPRRDVRLDEEPAPADWRTDDLTVVTERREAAPG